MIISLAAFINASVAVCASILGSAYRLYDRANECGPVGGKLIAIVVSSLNQLSYTFL